MDKYLYLQPQTAPPALPPAPSSLACAVAPPARRGPSPPCPPPQRTGQAPTGAQEGELARGLVEAGWGVAFHIVPSAQPGVAGEAAPEAGPPQPPPRGRPSPAFHSVGRRVAGPGPPPASQRGHRRGPQLPRRRWLRGTRFPPGWGPRGRGAG